MDSCPLNVHTTADNFCDHALSVLSLCVSCDIPRALNPRSSLPLSSSRFLISSYIGAHSYGTPTAIFSYAFIYTNAGAPSHNTGVCSATAGSDEWNCQHRDLAILNMVGFHDTAGSVDARGLGQWH